MRLIQTIVLLGGAAYAAPALQQPLTQGPCNMVATKVHWAEPTSASEEPPCSTPTLTSVTFNELAVTYYGEEIYVTGGISQLGDWSAGLHLNSSEYTAENPLWYLTVDLPVGAEFEYKYLRREPDGSVIWESDPNRNYTVEGNCDGKATLSDSWR